MKNKAIKWFKEYKWIIIIGTFLSMPMIAKHFVLGHAAYITWLILMLYQLQLKI